MDLSSWKTWSPLWKTSTESYAPFLVWVPPAPRLRKTFCDCCRTLASIPQFSAQLKFHRLPWGSEKVCLPWAWEELYKGWVLRQEYYNPLFETLACQEFFSFQEAIKQLFIFCFLPLQYKSSRERKYALFKALSSVPRALLGIW